MNFRQLTMRDGSVLVGDFRLVALWSEGVSMLAFRGMVDGDRDEAPRVVAAAERQRAANPAGREIVIPVGAVWWGEPVQASLAELAEVERQRMTEPRMYPDAVYEVAARLSEPDHVRRFGCCREHDEQAVIHSPRRPTGLPPAPKPVGDDEILTRERMAEITRYNEMAVEWWRHTFRDIVESHGGEVVQAPELDA